MDVTALMSRVFTLRLCVFAVDEFLKTLNNFIDRDPAEKEGSVVLFSYELYRMVYRGKSETAVLELF